jgi:hypothetical protein
MTFVKHGSHFKGITNTKIGLFAGYMSRFESVLQKFLGSFYGQVLSERMFKMKNIFRCLIKSFVTELSKTISASQNTSIYEPHLIKLVP